jgi:hypothetical protein
MTEMLSAKIPSDAQRVNQSADLGRAPQTSQIHAKSSYLGAAGAVSNFVGHHSIS